jgi:hypothetical protein
VQVSATVAHLQFLFHCAALRASLLRAAAAAELKMLYFIQIHVQK